MTYHAHAKFQFQIARIHVDISASPTCDANMQRRGSMEDSARTMGAWDQATNELKRPRDAEIGLI